MLFVSIFFIVFLVVFILNGIFDLLLKTGKNIKSWFLSSTIISLLSTLLAIGLLN